MRYSSDNLDILEMVDLFNEWNIDDVLKEDSRTIEELKFSTTTMEQYKKILDKKVYEMLTLVVEVKHLIENDKDGSNLNKIRTAGVKIGNFINQQFKIKDAKLDRLEFVNVNDFNTAYTYISKSNYKIKLLGPGRVEVQSLTTPEFTIKISYKMVRLLEADEILAIILHELGHNYHMLRVLFEGEKAVRYEDLRKRMSKQYGFFSGPLGIIFGIILGASIIGAPLLLMLLMQSGQLLHIRTNYLKGEIPADDFAVMHKLGGPLATGLKKVIFEAYHKNDQKFDKIGGLLNKFRVMKSIFSFNIDDILNERAIFILNSLEEQLNSTKKIAPEEEKNLREQIKNVREVITDRSFKGKVKEIKERLFSDEMQALIMRRAGLISETTSSDIEAFPYGIYFDFSEAKAEIDFLKSNERLLSLEEMKLLNQLNEAVTYSLKEMETSIQSFEY